MEMIGHIYNTDSDWYHFLASQPPLDEVNFWLPRDTRHKKIQPGAPFIFKLKAEHDHAIAGFGFFQRSVNLPIWLAWESFEEANGAADQQAFEQRLFKYRGIDRTAPIGCLLISSPVFFPPGDWPQAPQDWKANIVQGRQYNLAEGEGLRIWQDCQAAAGSHSLTLQLAETGAADKWGTPQLVKPRLGQGGFRVAVTEAYARACAVSGEHSLPVLEAAHIRPYAKEGSHDVRNGLLLRADIHKLYDKGYVTVTPDHRFEVSRRLKEDYDNGKIYYREHGKLIHLPANRLDRPDPEALVWHNEKVFAG